jgi:DnaJ family protein C protein 8
MDKKSVEQYLRLEENQFNQDQEVERIMGIKGSQDPLQILGIPTEYYLTLDIPPKIIKVQFRKRSLLVHPDKCKHPNAREAFDELTRAQNEWEDMGKKRLVIGYIQDARDSIFHRQGIKIPRKPTKEEFQEILEKYPNIGRLIQLEFIRIQRELLYRDKTRLKNEVGRELEREKEQKSREEKEKEFEKEWEKTRQERIKSWKKFNDQKVTKKKKSTVLGKVPLFIKKK